MEQANTQTNKQKINKHKQTKYSFNCTCIVDSSWPSGGYQDCSSLASSFMEFDCNANRFVFLGFCLFPFFSLICLLYYNKLWIDYGFFFLVPTCKTSSSKLAICASGTEDYCVAEQSWFPTYEGYVKKNFISFFLSLFFLKPYI